MTVEADGQSFQVNVDVIPLRPSQDQGEHFLVLFEEVPTAPASKARTRRPGGKKADAQIDRLQDELAATKATLQGIIQEREATSEELLAANEEIRSANEELQSTNEELETAKEELQSANEELSTVNEELETRNVELSQVNDDLENLLTSAEIPMVVLDLDMRIRSFTAAAGHVLKLIAADRGRPIGQLSLGVDVEDLGQQVSDVIRTPRTVDQEVRSRHTDRWYSMRIRPYTTAENKIEGTVLSLIDITDRKLASDMVEDARAYAEGVVETVREPLVVLDAGLRVLSANPSFYRTFRVEPGGTQSQRIYDLGDGQWDIPGLRKLLEEIIPQNAGFCDFEVEHEFPHIGRKKMLLNARRIEQRGGRPHLILLAIEDVTDDEGA